jgi:hypothetical protein
MMLLAGQKPEISSAACAHLVAVSLHRLQMEKEGEGIEFSGIFELRMVFLWKMFLTRMIKLTLKEETRKSEKESNPARL